MYKAQPTKYLHTHHVQWTTVNILLYLLSFFSKEKVCNQILQWEFLFIFHRVKGLLKSIRMNYSMGCPHPLSGGSLRAVELLGRWPCPSRGVNDSALVSIPPALDCANPTLSNDSLEEGDIGYCPSLGVFDSCWSEICLLCVLVNLRFFYVNGMLESCVLTLFIYFFCFTKDIFIYNKYILLCTICLSIEFMVILDICKFLLFFFL